MIDISKASPERQLSYCKAQLDADKQYLKMEISDELREEIELEDLTLRIAIKALEYRVAKKPEFDAAHQEKLCPICMADVSYKSSFESGYCRHCGQKLAKG